MVGRQTGSRANFRAGRDPSGVELGQLSLKGTCRSSTLRVPAFRASKESLQALAATVPQGQNGRSCVVPPLVPFGLPKSGESFEDRRNFGDASADEAASDGFGCNWGGCLHKVIAHGPDALGEVRRPRKTRGAHGLLLFLFHLRAETCLSRGGSLKFGPEPSDQTGAFFCGTGAIELDQAEKNIFG